MQYFDFQTLNLIFQREIILFINDLEAELRKQRRITEVYTLFELCEELGVFPSKYQRPNMLFDNLKAQPVWDVEETGQKDYLMKIQDNWKQVGKHLKFCFLICISD